MTSRRTAWVGGVLGLLMAMTTTALAHHSFAVFDHTRTLTIKGTVTKFQWTNPHAFLEVDIPQPDGTMKHFSIELTSINMMQRVGWRSNMIKAGDKITIDDPVTLEKPHTYTVAYRRMPNYTLLEYVCEDNREYADDKGLQKIRIN